MAHLRNYQTGKHADLSQRLLNEVAAARVCLLNGAKKAAYDKQLRAKVEQKSVATQVRHEEPAAAYELQPLVRSSLLTEMLDQAAEGPALQPRRQPLRILGRRVPTAKLVGGMVAVVVVLMVARAIERNLEVSGPPADEGKQQVVVVPDAAKEAKRSSE